MSELSRYLDPSHFNRALTVGALKEALDGFTDETLVVFSYNYGDHWRTEVAERVMSAEEGTVVWSEYHRMPKVLDEDDREEYDPDEVSAEELAAHKAETEAQVVILRSIAY